MSGVKYYLESPVTLRESGKIFDEDKLGMSDIAERFIEDFLFLKKDDSGFWNVQRNTSGSIGIVSEVGTGKSFFLNILYDYLNFENTLKNLKNILEKKRNNIVESYNNTNKLRTILNDLLKLCQLGKYKKIIDISCLEQLKNIDKNLYENFLICIDNFVYRITQLLKKKQEYEVVYIDIAKYQFEPDIFYVIYKELYNQLLLYEQIKDYIKINIEVIYNVLQVASRYNKEIKKVFNYINTIKDLYNAFNDSFSKIDYLKKFKFSDQREKIIEIAEKLENKQIFIIIDNLEKTKPEFIIDFLFKMREMFETFENWLFILSYDKYEVQHALKAFYGENFNTQGFFRKFISTEFKLDRFYENVDSLYIEDKVKNFLNSVKYDEEKTNNILNVFIKNSIKEVYKKYNFVLLKEFLNNEKSDYEKKFKLLSLRFLKLMYNKLLHPSILKEFLKVDYDITEKKYELRKEEIKKIYIIMYLIIIKFLDEECYDNLFEKIILTDDYCKHFIESFFNNDVFYAVLFEINIDWEILIGDENSHIGTGSALREILKEINFANLIDTECEDLKNILKSMELIK